MIEHAKSIAGLILENKIAKSSMRGFPRKFYASKISSYTVHVILHRPNIIFVQFRYATCLDVLLMLMGLVAAFLSGAAFPIAMNVFGDITNLFIRHQISRDLANLQVALCPSSTAPIPVPLSNLTGGVVDCQVEYSIPGCTFNLTQLYEDCINNERFISEINIQVYAFVAIAVGCFLFSWLHVWLFQAASERQTHRIRLTYYNSILRQDIGWFEDNSSGELTNRLSR